MCIRDSPNNEDSDNDGLLDGVETNTGTFSGATDTGTDPLMIDTDGDSAADGFEVTEGTDPNDPDSTPGFPTIQPSFIPINEAAPGAYAPDLTQSGVNYQENHYGGGVILNGQPEANYNAHTSGSPAPLRSFDAIEPVTSHGVGGTAISFLDRPWLDGGGENFSVRYNGYLDMTGFVPGTYTIHLGADDTNYFIMDTADGQVTGQHSCCPQNQATAFTMTTPGIFPFDNVFGEQGGGDWTDIGISGPGIVGIVAIGDTAAGSPPVYPIGVNAADTDGDGLLDGVETNTGVFVSASDTGSDPLAADTDEDGASDGFEVSENFDPNDPDSSPDIPVVQPSFVPINELVPGAYGPDLAQNGVDYQENHYGGGVIFNNNAQNNYDVHTSGNPAPLRSFDAIAPLTSHGNGGGQISNRNLPWGDGGGENFTVRYNGYLDMSTFAPGTYNIHLGADDTNYFIMDTELSLIHI